MKKTTCSLILLLAFNLLTVFAQDKPRLLTVKDYDNWQSLGQAEISPDGNWMGYSLDIVKGTDTLYIIRTSGGERYLFPHGNQLAFTMNSSWAACLQGFSEEERERMQEKKQEARNSLNLLRLSDGRKEKIEEIRSFKFSRDSKFLVMETYPEKEKTGDLIIRNLETGKSLNLGNVSEWSLNKPGTYLACLIDAEEKRGNAAELIRLADFRFFILDSDTTTYHKISWEKEGRALAFLKAFKDTSYAEDNHILYALPSLEEPDILVALDPRKMKGFPENMRISETYSPVWAEDRSLLFFGVIDWTPADKDSTKKQKRKTEKLPGVEIWHWKDDPIQPRQEKTYRTDRDFTYLCSWNLKPDRMFVLSDEKAREASLGGNQQYALLWDKSPYQPQFRLEHGDLYLVGAKDGKRNKVLSDFIIPHFAGSSPDGKYLLYFRDKNWWTYDILKDKHFNLTAGTGVDFWNTRDDGPLVEEQKPPFGMAGWLKDDRGVILYSEYDVWSFAPDGSETKNLTGRSGQEIRCRFIRLDREEDWIDPQLDMYFSMFGDKTKKSGFGRIHPGGTFQQLIYKDKLIQRLQKAKASENFIYTEESYEDSPDVFFTKSSFKEPVQLTNTNPQQADYAWGKATLVQFSNKQGKDLQGVLYYPAGYTPGKQYPMLVYIYEILSNSLHRYITPSPQSFYNITHYTQQGYFVFLPDIVYRVNEPGMSAVECVVPAVRKVLETGMIDSTEIGLMGHSWGAYQTSFIITQTHLFSAAVAGAPLTNMISMYNSIYWNTGTPDQSIFETSQGRFREPYWKLMDEYIRNSPIFQAENITTPLLVAFGDEDGAVDWHQGIEMYITMRRLQKPMIMLVYAGENHGVRKKENTLDYTRKIHQFFAHYLKGEPAEPWIDEGVKYVEKKKLEEKQTGNH